MALPFSDASFDAAVMSLVIFFVPEPARGVAEMARVVRPGGVVAAYVWDVMGGGLPFPADHRRDDRHGAFAAAAAAIRGSADGGPARVVAGRRPGRDRDA